ncbi:MAG: hypothetical protein HZB41_06600 [Ignavibacteriae bacterium]|nr:hypothetical protein [Ignavibacteriota bacterium]
MKYPILILYIVLLCCCDTQKPINDKIHQNDSTGLSIYVIPEDLVELYKKQPEIIKIGIIDNDTLFLTYKYYNGDSLYKLFRFKNFLFHPLLKDDSLIEDFQKYNSGQSLFVKKKSNDKFTIYDNKKTFLIDVSEKPILIDASINPTFLVGDTLFIMDYNNGTILKKDLSFILKKYSKRIYRIKSLTNFIDVNNGATALYNNKFYIFKDEGEFGGYGLEFDLIKNKVKLINITNINKALILNDSLYITSGLAHMGMMIGKLYQFNNGFKEVLKAELYRLKDFEKKPYLSSFETIYFDSLSNSIIIGMYNGIAIINNKTVKRFINFDFELKFPDYSAMNNPTQLVRAGNNLYVRTYRGGLYIFDFETLKFIKRIIFSDDNLIDFNKLY